MPVAASWKSAVVREPPLRDPSLCVSPAGRQSEGTPALAAHDVPAPAGSLYAHEPFTVLKLQGPALRAGPSPYNTPDDVDRLLDGLAAFL
ncbi:hypothetical protein GCM10011578_013620 [Streptomyces fuscichromogenes]|uniref:Uncharacterized protein n=1 Tax=Streptomyces fuscichromogenes TaxID=1324013 RepID=A0A917UJG4_9ACTN|nr:hypothetical protein GCM10011578_013620 [Streptomyces fuscichromogenes]